jgi:hypothetical protein
MKMKNILNNDEGYNSFPTMGTMKKWVVLNLEPHHKCNDTNY